MTEKIAFLFPGQGSQAIGMGKDLYEHSAPARAIFDAVDTALDEKLSDLIFGGDSEQLNLTANTQPALMAVSQALVAALKAGGYDILDKGYAMAGHSLGEYSAYAAGNTFSLEDTSQLLRTRGEAMQSAVPVGEGAMAAVIGMAAEPLEEICKTASQGRGVCTLANDNCPGQIVISGSKEAVENAAQKADEAGARKVVMLPVSAPFHCPMMTPAAAEMNRALGAVKITMPGLPVYTNITTAPAKNTENIHQTLVDQVTGQVRWRETIDRLIDEGVETFIELGAGKVLTGLMRRIDRSKKAISIQTYDDVQTFLEQNS